MNLGKPITKDELLIYEGNYLIVETKNRIVSANEIMYSGIIRNQLSIGWKMLTDSIIPHDIIATDSKTLLTLGAKPDQIGRVVAVQKCIPIPFYCIVRGYYVPTCSNWNSYCEAKKICGIQLPEGLKESEVLPYPIFTPTNNDGKNISFDEMRLLTLQYIRESMEVSNDIEFSISICEKIRKVSMNLYEFAHNYSLDRGIILADATFKFGLNKDQLIVISELLTPNTSRYWYTDNYEVGKLQRSLCIDNNTTADFSNDYCDVYYKLFGQKINDLIDTIKM